MCLLQLTFSIHANTSLLGLTGIKDLSPGPVCLYARGMIIGLKRRRVVSSRYQLSHAVSFIILHSKELIGLYKPPPWLFIFDLKAGGSGLMDTSFLTLVKGQLEKPSPLETQQLSPMHMAWEVN